MRFRGGEFSTGTMGNFQPELTPWVPDMFRRYRIPRALTFWTMAISLSCEPSGRASSTATSFSIRLSDRPVGRDI
jgi:hypothetical protein